MLRLVHARLAARAQGLRVFGRSFAQEPAAEADDAVESSEGEVKPAEAASHWDTVYKKARKESITYGDLRDEITFLDKVSPEEKQYLDHVYRHFPNGVLDLSFLGPQYNKKRFNMISGQPRRPVEEYVPPPPQDGEFERDTFVVPPTAAEAAHPELLEHSASEGQYTFWRRLSFQQLKQPRIAYMKEYRTKEEAAAAKRAADYNAQQAQKVLTAQWRQERGNVRKKKLQDELQQLQVVLQLRAQQKAQRRELRMAKRREVEAYQVAFVQRERVRWFEDPEAITEEVFAPQHECAPHGWWPKKDIRKPLVALQKPFADDILSEMSVEWTEKDVAKARKEAEEKDEFKKGTAWD